MSQLVIQFNWYGEWAVKYVFNRYRKYKTLSVPRRMRQKDWVIGVIVDNRIKWRERLDSITQNADYDIIVKEGEK